MQQGPPADGLCFSHCLHRYAHTHTHTCRHALLVVNNVASTLTSGMIGGSGGRSSTCVLISLCPHHSSRLSDGLSHEPVEQLYLLIYRFIQARPVTARMTNVIYSGLSSSYANLMIFTLILVHTVKLGNMLMMFQGRCGNPWVSDSSQTICQLDV